jgi:hypothetical protein
MEKSLADLAAEYDRFPLGHKDYKCPTCSDDMRLHSAVNLLKHTEHLPDLPVDYDPSTPFNAKPEERVNKKQFKGIFRKFRKKD